MPGKDDETSTDGDDALDDEIQDKIQDLREDKADEMEQEHERREQESQEAQQARERWDDWIEAEAKPVVNAAIKELNEGPHFHAKERPAEVMGIGTPAPGDPIEIVVERPGEDEEATFKVSHNLSADQVEFDSSGLPGCRTGGQYSLDDADEDTVRHQLGYFVDALYESV